MAVTLPEALADTAWRVIEDSAFSSLMWTPAEITGYFSQRQNRFNRDTLLMLAHQPISFVAGQETADLPSDWIATQNASWSNVVDDDHPAQATTVGRSDRMAGDLGISSTNNPPLRPVLFDDNGDGPLRITLMPAPLTDGQLDLLYACVLETLDLDADPPDIFDIPDDFIPYVLYGVLADMLSKEGQGRDLARAKYCQLRYQEGVELAAVLLSGFF